MPNLDPIPPGETGIELSGDGAARALSASLKVLASVRALTTNEEHGDMAVVTRMRLIDLDVSREGRYIVLTAVFAGKPKPTFTLRLSRSWAQTLRNRLTKVLR
jgi:hypothetical protein